MSFPAASTVQTVSPRLVHSLRGCGSRNTQILFIMNTYHKYYPNVFVAKCTEQHEKGSLITLTTKYGKEHECIVFNRVGTDKEGNFYYSIVRADGFNAQERAKAKAEKYNKWSESASKASNQKWEESKEGRDFLALGEPIKIGHHSEKRHRALIERNHNRMNKAVELQGKAESHQSKAQYWETKAKDVNLSMPESLDFYEFKLEEAKKKHQYLKDNPEARAHSYSLTYANKEVKEMEKNVQLAVKLWGDIEEVKQMEAEKQEAAQKKAQKSSKFNDLMSKFGGFFAFNNDQFKKGYQNLKDQGFINEGEKVTHLKAGLYVPSKHKDEFIHKL